MEGLEESQRIRVEIQGKQHQVPKGISMLQAYWFIGEEPIHGVGCLGGVCGACTVSFQTKESPQMQTGLACQMPIQDGMSFSLFPIAPPKIKKYQLSSLQNSGAELLRLYPETKRCVSCRACTVACPQDIEVMDGVLSMIRGNLESAADLFYNCVMCGLCSMVCDVGIKPQMLGLYARRVLGRDLAHHDGQLIKRVQEIEEGVFDQDWEKILYLDEEALLALNTQGRD